MTRIEAACFTIAAASLALACGTSGAGRPTGAVPDPHIAVVTAIRPIVTDRGALFDLDSIAHVLSRHRIVLLGENGHGVNEFSAFKSALVRKLHQDHGFGVVAFESGFHECREANERLAERPAIQSQRDCLLVQLHHQEILPLFEYAVRVRSSVDPLVVAGIDLQIQGWSSRSRPSFLRQALALSAPQLGDTIAVLDSTLVEMSFQPPDSVQRFMRENGRFLAEAYDSAVTLTRGDTSWTFRAASELARRELHRAAAVSYGLAAPSDVYEIRDVWMAETIAYLLESGPADRRIVVWLHNDHARYGEWEAGPLRVRSSGLFLKERLGDDVVSVGLLMGAGTFANNSRREQQVPELPEASLESTFRQAGYPVSFLVLDQPRGSLVEEWADRVHPYIRDTRVFTMRPGREFDILVWFDSVSTAKYLGR